MRGGRVLADTPAAGVSPAALARLMVGEREAAKPRDGRVSGPVVLSLRDLTSTTLRDVSLDVSQGEIVAIAGVAGNGQNDLTSLLRGLSVPARGTIVFEGRAIDARELRENRALAHIPEDRTLDGLVGEMSIAENIGLTEPRWNPASGAATAARLIEQYGVRAGGPHQATRELSGGNQQKVLLARELDRKPRLIVAAEPTRGLDVAATEFVHAQLLDAAGTGAGILLITSDLDEAFALADAMHVLYRGSLSERLTTEDARQRVAALMAGLS
jgi:general nucleoside transport system ATP-binding protein